MLSFLAPLLVALPLSTPAPPAIALKARPDLQPQIDAEIERALPDLVAYYLDLHAHPELSTLEERTSGKIAAELKSLGYEVTERVGGFGVVAVLKGGPGRTLLVRADMDALPLEEKTGRDYASKVVAKDREGATVPVMHACGHDMHQACLVGVARVMKALAKEWHGTLVLVAQPAEEIGMGARLMIEDGMFTRFPKPDVCLALHVSSAETGVISYTKGFALANVDSVDITVFGVGGHGSRPEAAVDPIVMASQVVLALQTIVSRRVAPQDAAVVTVGSFHAGLKHNIIPSEAKLQLTVRSYKDSTRKLVLDSIKQIATDTCRAMGAKQDPEVVVRDAEFTPATYNDPALVDASLAVLAGVVPQAKLVEDEPLMGGEDFGRFPKEAGVPGFLFRVGSIDRARLDDCARKGDAVPSQHSPLYWPEPAPTAKSGVRAMCALALAVLSG